VNFILNCAVGCKYESISRTRWVLAAVVKLLGMLFDSARQPGLILELCLKLAIVDS
jgi:hypothetical protein